MKKLLLLVVAGLVACVSGTPTTSLLPPPTTESPVASPESTVTTVFEVYKIPSGYYDRTCQKPAHLTFYDWMTTLQVPPYEKGAFDCSQRAAYIEWLSENCNHRAMIAGYSGHLWVLIDLGGLPLAYEAGRLPENPWVPLSGVGSTHFHYNPDSRWRSIYEAPWAHSYFEEEFAWWLTYPELWR